MTGQEISPPNAPCHVPLVSVVIPVYNRWYTVGRAISSVLAQTWQDWELLVVDDGSTDDTSQVVRQCADPRLHLLSHPTRKGAAAARNTGVRAAQSDWVAFLDSDDEWLPDRLEQQMRRLLDSPSPMPAVGLCLVQEYNERTRETRQPIDAVPEGEAMIPLLQGQRPPTASAFVVLRAALQAVGGFDESLPAGHDIDLLLRLAQGGYRFSGVNAPLVIWHRYHGAALTGDAQARWISYWSQERRWGPLMRQTFGDVRYWKRRIWRGRRVRLLQSAAVREAWQRRDLISAVRFVGRVAALGADQAHAAIRLLLARWIYPTKRQVGPASPDPVAQASTRIATAPGSRATAERSASAAAVDWERVAGRAILVGGMPRSGTTLMIRLLNRHRDIAGFGESKLATWRIFRRFPTWLYLCPVPYRPQLLSVYKKLCLTRFYCHRVAWRVPRPALLAWKIADRLWTLRFYRALSLWSHNPVLAALENAWLADAPQARMLRRPPQDAQERRDQGVRGLRRFFRREQIEESLPLLDAMLEAESLQSAHRLYGAFWGHLFTAYAREKGKTFWAEKTPENASFAPFFYRCFPELRMIHMVRDGRDVACSRSKMPWGREGFIGLIDSWGEGLTKERQRLSEVPAECYLDVRYEDLVLRTEATLRRILDFLGLDWDPAMLSQRIYDTSIGRHKTELSPEARCHALKNWQALLSAYGYDHAQEVG